MPKSELQNTSLLTAMSFFLILLLVTSCSIPEEIVEEEEPEEEEEKTEEVVEEPSERDPDDMPEDPDAEPVDVERSEMDIDFRSYRSSLRDQYAHVQTSVPDAYLDAGEEEERRISNSGFRVQIASTRDMSEADQYQEDFTAWADTLDFDAKPESYISFRQPNYRVHVGDFLSRSDAIAFSEIVKQKFEEAWVVRDQIDTSVILRALEEEEDLVLDELAEEEADVEDKDEEKEDDDDEEEENDDEEEEIDE